MRTNSASVGLAERGRDLAVVRRPWDDSRFASAVVGLERRLLLVDRRTGKTTPQPWPEGERHALQEARDVDHRRTIRRTKLLTILFG
ncbi:hypothetical protein [Streptomyces canus]|uniref:hypothetical protein n=1 Tax=Streptomyces canus TaxID=58343 RepID=UPI0036E2F857